MRVVLWTTQAQADLAAIRAFISQDSPHYASFIVSRLIAATDRLVPFPESGRAVPEFEDPLVREVVRAPYRVVYLVRDLYDAFGRGDIPTILNMLADDVDWYDPGPPAVTHAGRYRGREDVLRFFSRIGESLAIESFQPTEFIVQGDRVIVLGSIRAKVKQTGLAYDNEWAMSWTLRDGRITKWQIYEDTARELAAHAPAGV